MPFVWPLDILMVGASRSNFFIMNFKHAFFLLLCGFFLTNCTKDELPEQKESVTDSPEVLAIQAEVDAAIAELKNDEPTASEGISSRSHVYVPAGTADRLADAIGEAGPFGTVVLAAGMHYENSTVMISSPVTIRGEDGAVLRLTTNGPLSVDDFPYEPTPGIHVKNTAFVRIGNLAIEPMTSYGVEPEGGLAILLEDAPNTRIYDNEVSDFQFGVLLAGADQARIYGNTFHGFNFDGDHIGVVAMDGEYAKIYENDFAFYTLGLFASDRKGTAYENHFHNNTIGLLLCTVPEIFVLNGELAGAPVPANKWTVNKNTADQNGWGYLVIDGANRNILHLNDASESGFYDIELAGDSERFGFFTPTSSKNFVCSYGPSNHLSVKDCGYDNAVYGGQHVDTDADPCF